MDINNLTNELAIASAQRADAELNRLITANKDAVVTKKEELKRYLLKIATVPGTLVDNNAATNMVAELTTYQSRVVTLEAFKKELE